MQMYAEVFYKSCCPNRQPSQKRVCNSMQRYANDFVGLRKRLKRNMGEGMQKYAEVCVIFCWPGSPKGKP